MGFLDKTIISIFSITALSNTAYAIIAPFLPFEFEKKQINQSLIGYIFAVYSVSVIIASPIIGKMISKFGRRLIIQAGVTLMGFSFILFAFLSYLSNPVLYTVAVILIRMLQGFASSCIQTTCYSICTNFYPEKKEALVGYIEAVTGIGLILGPIVGSVLYTLGGFFFTFFIFGTIFILASFIVKRILPKRVDNDEIITIAAQMQQYKMLSDDHHRQNKLGYVALLKNRRFTLGAFSASLGYFLYGFMEPILAFRLNSFQLSQIQIGLFFTILPVFYIPTSIFVQYIPRGIQKRAILITASALSFIVNICVGPSQLLGFPDSLWIMAVGQALHGLVDPLILVPSLPEMIESVIDDYPDQEFELNDLSAAVFNCFLGIGQVTGPLYGSIMTEYLNFRLTCDYVAVLCLGFAFIYFITGQGWSAFTQSKCTNYGEHHEFGSMLTTSLNRSRLLSVNSHDIYVRKRQHSEFSNLNRTLEMHDKSGHF